MGNSVSGQKLIRSKNAMASNSTPDDHRDSANTPQSHFQHTVCLADWWLVKAKPDSEGRRLAVAGFTSREKQALRVFSSAPIAKRHDAFTLETSDGICIKVNGLINKARTIENGFPSDVFNHFLFGFPLCWKEYGEKFVGEESSSKDILGVDLVTEKRFAQTETVVTEQPRVQQISRGTMSRPVTRAFSSSQMKDKNKAWMSGDEEVRSKPVPSMGSDKVELASADHEPKGISNCNSENSGFQGATDKFKFRDIDASSSKDELVVTSKTSDLDKDLRKVRRNGNMQPAKDRAARSCRTPVIADKKKENTIADKTSLSEKDMKIRRKLAFGTPEREKQNVFSASPQSSSLNRSRSGRLLMPTLEFWRNQRAVYSADRTITAIEDGEQQERKRNGSGSMPRRKRRKLTGRS